MKKYLSIAALALATIATSVSALTLSDALSKFDGQEITATGSIGYSWISDEDIQVKIDGVLYDVVLDAGRTARRSIEGCKFTLFGNSEKPCKATISAEIEVNGDAIRLIVFELDLI